MPDSDLKKKMLSGLSRSSTINSKSTQDFIFFPKLLKIRQKFNQQTITAAQIPDFIKDQMELLHLETKVKPGDSVAITAGSRGIAHITAILKVVVDFFKGIGCCPFIFPAMGSHGGGTLEGQLKILENYGITEKVMGCPIKGTMEVDLIGKTTFGTEIYLDRFAAQADHIFVVNRIKPHTKFSGRVESGLMKMCLIGMGKCQGAQIYHQAAERYPWDKVVYAVYEILTQKKPILGGLAILENAYDEIADIQALNPEEIPIREPELLEQAYHLLPRIPFPEVDLLIVDEMGKNISGTGMDTIVVGKKPISPINVKLLYVRELTEQSHGNAQGIGFADFTRLSLIEKMDFSATYLNSQTAFRTQAPKIPMTLSNDKEALQVALKMSGFAENPQDLKLVWIKNTLELVEFIVSEAFLGEIEQNSNLEVISQGIEMDFDKEGNLLMNTDKSFSPP